MDNISIVTAFFDIGRGNLPTTKHGRILPHYQHRNVDTYFDFFRKQAKIENNMVIHTSENFADRIYDIRKEFGMQNATDVVVHSSFLPNDFIPIKEKIEHIMQSPEYYNKVLNPQLIEYWHSDYVLVNILKSFYVTESIRKGLIKTDLTAWIDFGYCRTDETIPKCNKWNYNFNKEKIHFFNIHPIDVRRPVDTIIYTGDVYIMGCHIVAGTHKWNGLRELMEKNLNDLLEHNLIDDDQTLLLMSYLTAPEEFELRYVDPSDWFIIFKKYNTHNF